MEMLSMSNAVERIQFTVAVFHAVERFICIYTAELMPLSCCYDLI